MSYSRSPTNLHPSGYISERLKELERQVEELRSKATRLEALVAIMREEQKDRNSKSYPVHPVIV